MLILLLKTRFKFYKNYLKHHFDKTTTFEILLIVLVLLLLLIRSPSDIGYNFQWMSDTEFPTQWARIFASYLLIFYIISEIFAIYTLRISKEWQLLGALPMGRKTIANYYLIRHTGKTVILLLFGSVPFLVALISPFGTRFIRFFTALGILLLLQIISFFQAHRFRNGYLSPLRKIVMWLPLELVIIALLIFIGPIFTAVMNSPSAGWTAAFFPAWFVFFGLLFYCRKSFILKQRDHKVLRQVEPKEAIQKFQTRNIFHGNIRAFIMRDILLLWRRRRRSFFIPLIATLVLLAVVVAEENSSAVYVSLIFVEAIFSFLLIKTVLTFFEWDGDVAHLIRSLPIRASRLWFARWLVSIGLIALPIIFPLVVILFKFGPSLEFYLFAAVAVGILPAIMATIYCNGGFGMFPHFNLSGYIISISISLIFLLWFFMPFGSIILLTVMMFWIRKSQKHFQNLELQ